MNQALLDTAARLIEGAKKRGAEGARASAYNNRQSELEWRDGKLDRLKQSTSQGVGLTLFVDGRFSSNNTSDLRPEALEKFLDQTVAMTRLLARDPYRRLPDAARYGDRFQGDLQVYDEAGLAAMNSEKRRTLARQLEEAARSAPGAEHIVSVTTSAGEGVSSRRRRLPTGFRLRAAPLSSFFSPRRR